MLGDPWFISHAGWWLVVDALIVGLLLPRVILERRETGATLAWVLTIILLPFIGLLGFWLFGTVRLRIRRRKRRKSEEHLEPALRALTEGRNEVPHDWGDLTALVHLATQLDGEGPLAGNTVRLYRNGRATFDEIEQQIRTAQDHIHLLYYIWEPDNTGRRIRDALVGACKRGVEVRLLVDDVGSYGTRKGFFEPLLEAGGKVAWFLKVNPLSRQININNRNHRKIIVLDGTTGFTGGMNIGDDYAGEGQPWKDLHCRITGPVVNTLQEVFCQDWYHATGEDLVNIRFFPRIAPCGEVYAQMLASGPADEKWRSIHTLIFAAINLATDKVWIETPYFIPDPPIAMALQTAALRGVDVRILLPGKSDHPLVVYAGNYFVDDLLAAGVRFFQDFKAMPHAKAVIIDDRFVTLGSANMDQRSFRLNFEANLFLFSEDINRQMVAEFKAQASRMEEITEQRRQLVPLRQKFVEGFARLLAPLL
jgi:cardiolipin synthase